MFDSEHNPHLGDGSRCIVCWSWSFHRAARAVCVQRMPGMNYCWRQQRVKDQNWLPTRSSAAGAVPRMKDFGRGGGLQTQGQVVKFPSPHWKAYHTGGKSSENSSCYVLVFCVNIPIHRNVFVKLPFCEVLLCVLCKWSLGQRVHLRGGRPASWVEWSILQLRSLLWRWTGWRDHPNSEIQSFLSFFLCPSHCHWMLLVSLCIAHLLAVTPSAILSFSLPPPLSLSLSLFHLLALFAQPPFLPWSLSFPQHNLFLLSLSLSPCFLSSFPALNLLSLHLSPNLLLRCKNTKKTICCPSYCCRICLKFYVRCVFSCDIPYGGGNRCQSKYTSPYCSLSCNEGLFVDTNKGILYVYCQEM